MQSYLEMVTESLLENKSNYCTREVHGTCCNVEVDVEF